MLYALSLHLVEAIQINHAARVLFSFADTENLRLKTATRAWALPCLGANVQRSFIYASQGEARREPPPEGAQKSLG